MARFSRVIPLAVAAVLCVVIVGCFFPEQFDLMVTVNKDGTYRMEFDGVLTHVMAKAHESQSGHLSANDEAGLKAMEADFLRDKRFKKAHYQGHGRFAVQYSDAGQLIQRVTLFSNELRLVRLQRHDNGEIELTGFSLSPKDLQQLKSIGMTVNGRIRVKTDGTVIKHNAQLVPMFLGLLGAYQWAIKSESDSLPAMTIKL